MEEDLHKAIKGYAATHGISLDQAYESAISNLVNPVAQDSRSDVLTHDERVLVDGLIRLVRSGEEMIDVVTSGLKLWMKDNPKKDSREKKKSA